MKKIILMNPMNQMKVKKKGIMIESNENDKEESHEEKEIKEI